PLVRTSLGPRHRGSAASGGSSAGSRALRSEGLGLAGQGTWISPTRSRHSAGIGAPDSSRRYQSWTWSTLTSRPEIVTIRALRTFAAASAATWFSKMAAYGVWDIHQRTR